MSDHEEDRSTTTAPSPPAHTAMLPLPRDAPRSLFYTTCELGSQAFERWQSYSQRSYDRACEDAFPPGPTGAHYDPLGWPPRITFQESQLRSTS